MPHPNFYGVLGILWTAAWLPYGTEKPSEHKGIAREDLKEIEAGQTAETCARPDSLPG